MHLVLDTVWGGGLISGVLTETQPRFVLQISDLDLPRKTISATTQDKDLLIIIMTFDFVSVFIIGRRRKKGKTTFRSFFAECSSTFSRRRCGRCRRLLEYEFQLCTKGCKRGSKFCVQLSAIDRESWRENTGQIIGRVGRGGRSDALLNHERKE